MKKNIFIVISVILCLCLLYVGLMHGKNTDIEDPTEQETTVVEVTEDNATETECDIEIDATEIIGPIEVTEVMDVLGPGSVYPIEYSDESCKITITKEWFENAWCYIAHLEFTDYSRFGSAVAKDELGNYETTSEAAERLGAMFCVNGSYMSYGSYAIVRSGKVFYDTSIIRDLAIYNSNTGILENAGILGVSGKLASSAVEDKEVTDTFKFHNSTLVRNGENVSNVNNGTRAQRTFIATNGNPGDIYVVVAEGRNIDGESPGLTKYECAKLILKLGCTYGVMLDGGGSSTMVWNGIVLNSARDNERAVIDFVYFK